MTTLDTPPATPAPDTGAGRAEPALDALWARLARPFDPVLTISGLIGLSPTVVGQLVGQVLATSPEADHLLDSFPHTIRQLATSMEQASERCFGNLRGPVLWSETNSARAATAGNPNLFVCLTPSRAYDIDENRVLVWALEQVRRGGQAALESVPGKLSDDPLMRAVRRNLSDASRFIEHPSLRGVTKGKPNPRAVKKTRAGRKRATYAPAVALLDRAAEPVGTDDLLPYLDRRTRAQHRLLMALVERLEAQGARLPDFRVEGGGLYTGPLQYHHPRGVPGPARLSGVLLGELLIDVPDRLTVRNRDLAQAALEHRAGGRAAAVVMDPDDLEAAIGRAIALARG